MKTKPVIEKSPQLCELSVSYQPKVKFSELPKITNSKDCEKIFREIWSEKINYVEEVCILLLNRNNKVLGWVKISTGGVSSTIMDPKVIFQHALLANASALILAHNHPSSNTTPSEADIRMTKQLKEGGKILDITLLDHLILTQDSFYSFADEGAI